MRYDTQRVLREARQQQALANDLIRAWVGAQRLLARLARSVVAALRGATPVRG